MSSDGPQPFGVLAERILKLAPDGTKAAGPCKEHGGEGEKDSCLQCWADRDSVSHQRRLAEDQRLAGQARIERMIGSAGIPARFQGMSFADFIAASDKQRMNLDRCKLYADGLKSGSGNLLLLGRKGTGKTLLACAIANHVMTAHGMTSVYALSSRLFRRVKETYGRRDGETESDVIRAYASPGLLVLDEIGIGKASDTDLDILFDVINERYENRRPTVVVSNIADTTELERWVGERTMDRLREGGRALIFDWESVRSSL